MSDRNSNRLGYKKTKVGWIPEGWKVISFGEIFQRVSKPVNVMLSEEYQEIGIRSHGKGIFHKERIRGTQLVDKSVFYVYVPALIFNIVFAWEQAVAVTDGSEQGKIASHRFPMYQIKDKTGDLHFFRLFFLTKHGKHLLELASPGGAGRNKTLGQKELSRLPIPLPPLTEQKKIFEILSTWDRSIDQTSRLLELKKKFKKGLMQQLLWGKKRLSSFNKSTDCHTRHDHRFFGIPSDWRCPQLKSVAKELGERNKKNCPLTVLTCSKHLGFVESSHYFGKKIHSEDTKSYKIIRRGCFGYPSNHIEEGSIGLLSKHCEGLVSPIYTVFKCDEKVVPEYLYAIFKTETFRHIFAVSTNSSVDRRGSLRWREFSLIRIPLPPIDEQQAIVKVVQSADQEITQFETKLKALEKQKRGLMQKMLTGEIRVAT